MPNSAALASAEQKIFVLRLSKAMIETFLKPSRAQGTRPCTQSKPRATIGQSPAQCNCSAFHRLETIAAAALNFCDADAAVSKSSSGRIDREAVTRHLL